MTKPAKPPLEVMRRVEELLREELDTLGVDVRALSPHEIAAGMQCSVHPDGALSYSWQGRPVLHVSPEPGEDGPRWRFFTADAPVQ